MKNIEKSDLDYKKDYFVEDKSTLLALNTIRKCCALLEGYEKNNFETISDIVKMYNGTEFKRNHKITEPIKRLIMCYRKKIIKTMENAKKLTNEEFSQNKEKIINGLYNPTIPNDIKNKKDHYIYNGKGYDNELQSKLQTDAPRKQSGGKRVRRKIIIVRRKNTEQPRSTSI